MYVSFFSRFMAASFICFGVWFYQASYVVDKIEWHWLLLLRGLDTVIVATGLGFLFPSKGESVSFEGGKRMIRFLLFVFGSREALRLAAWRKNYDAVYKPRLDALDVLAVTDGNMIAKMQGTDEIQGQFTDMRALREAQFDTFKRIDEWETE